MEPKEVFPEGIQFMLVVMNLVILYVLFIVSIPSTWTVIVGALLVPAIAILFKKTFYKEL